MSALLLWAVLVAAPAQLGPPLTAQVSRVVTLAPSLTEAVLALDGGALLVGVSRYDELPEVAGLPRVGGYLDPSVEAVLSLRPHLVVAQPSPGNQRPVEKMAELGLSVLVLPMQTVGDVQQALVELGRALGRAEAARVASARLAEAREQVRARARGLPKVRAFIAYDFQPLVVAARGSFAHELLEDAGGSNVAGAAKVPFPVYSVESAVAAKPQVVIDLSHASVGAERLKSLPGLKNARWVRMKSQALMHPGPSLGEGLEELFTLLHAAP